MQGLWPKYYAAAQGRRILQNWWIQRPRHHATQALRKVTHRKGDRGRHEEGDWALRESFDGPSLLGRKLPHEYRHSRKLFEAAAGGKRLCRRDSNQKALNGLPQKLRDHGSLDQTILAWDHLHINLARGLLRSRRQPLALRQRARPS